MENDQVVTYNEGNKLEGEGEAAGENRKEDRGKEGTVSKYICESVSQLQ
jgi:hypothetical protein